VPLDPAAAGLSLLIIDTGARHHLADGQYGERRRSVEQAATELGVGSLRELTGQPEALEQLADPLLRRRARHVVSENQRVLYTAGLLRRGALAEVGPLLTASHASLRDDYEVSWPQADVTVDAALAAGALGARMMGGGFGGAVLALVPAGQRGVIEAAINAAYAGRGWPPPAVSVAVPSDAARRLR
jgi:galactokinase